jgi:hypothetical protein
MCKERRNIMKTKMLRNMMIVVLLALVSAMQATAVNYKNTYNGVRNTEYRVQAVSSVSATTQSAGFQSTSAYSGQWNQDAQQSTLNADGTVNADAYGVGRSYVGPRRSGTNPGTPDDEEEEEGEQQPLGDGLLALMLCACAYLIVRTTRKEEKIG